jgi:hypothetical protein
VNEAHSWGYWLILACFGKIVLLVSFTVLATHILVSPRSVWPLSLGTYIHIYVITITLPLTTCRQHSEYSHQTTTHQYILPSYAKGRSAHMHILETFVDLSKCPMVSHELVDLYFAIQII